MSLSHDVFWDLADELAAADPVLEEGTLMGSRCLRANGEFLAMPELRTGALVVKLPAARVAELIDAGVGEAFAPAGRVFREWVTIPQADEELWRRLLGEGKAFVAG
jgi:hypothetical protein